MPFTSDHYWREGEGSHEWDSPYDAPDDCPDEEPEPEDAPQEDDVFTSDGGLTFHYCGRKVATGPDQTIAAAALREWMDRETHWPNVWTEGERGDCFLYDLNDVAPF